MYAGGVCRLHIGYSEYGVYAGGVYSTLDTVNMECMLWSLQYTPYSESMECMLVESIFTVSMYWIQ